MDNGRRRTKRVMIVAVSVVAIAVVWVALTTAWLWRHQERVVFQPPSTHAEAPAPARRVGYTSDDGAALFGYVLEPQHARSVTRVVLAFHGNADLAAWTVPWAHELSSRTGAVVFVPEWRGYGGIPGSPTYATAAADARGALRFARETWKGIPIVLFGHSLGSALAAEVAVAMQPELPAALALQSPFTSARDMATRMLFPPIPGLWRRISRVHYDTRAVVARIDVPVFVAHGSRDLNIPARMGSSVFEAARNKGELLLVQGAGHNDVPEVGGERYWSWMARAVSARPQ